MTSEPNTNIAALTDNIGKIIRGKTTEIRLVVATLLARGHILLEDNPGSGKTVLAKTLAQSISGGLNHTDQVDGNIMFRRVQFTPDLLPMDLLGTHIFDEQKKDFVFRKGPLFTNILLADEINRASPKVQSALLECMAENQITVGEKTHRLDNLFFCIATQNPIEMEGTYPLPAAQLDRFFMKITFGYTSEEVELDIYNNYLAINNITEQIKQVLDYDAILSLQAEAEKVFLHPELVAAVRNIVWGTRRHNDITLGCSTRGGIIFLKCLKAYALTQQRNFVSEDDIRDLAQPVLHHRLIFRNREASRTALGQVVGQEIDRLARLRIQG